MSLIQPTVPSQKQVYDPKTLGSMALAAGIISFFTHPLVAILAIVAGVVGCVFSIKKKRRGWMVACIIGILLGLFAIFGFVSGELQ